jgi:chemotaxis response regulator CheB
MAAREKSQSAAAQTKQKKRGTAEIHTRKIDPRNTKKIKEALFPIVGIGGSAGGFEAALELLRHLPPKTGVCGRAAS